LLTECYVVGLAMYSNTTKIFYEQSLVTNRSDLS